MKSWRGRRPLHHQVCPLPAPGIIALPAASTCITTPLPPRVVQDSSPEQVLRAAQLIIKETNPRSSREGDHPSELTAGQEARATSWRSCVLVLALRAPGHSLSWVAIEMYFQGLFPSTADPHPSLFPPAGGGSHSTEKLIGAKLIGRGWGQRRRLRTWFSDNISTVGGERPILHTLEWEGHVLSMLSPVPRLGAGDRCWQHLYPKSVHLTPLPLCSVPSATDSPGRLSDIAGRGPVVPIERSGSGRAEVQEGGCPGTRGERQRERHLGLVAQGNRFVGVALCLANKRVP